jgi:FkbM family methyltransferase
VSAVGRSDTKPTSEERRKREAFFDEARAYTTHVAVNDDDLLFFVETKPSRIGRDIFVRGFRNDKAILAKAVRRLHRRGPGLPDEAVFVDVGANIGSSTIHALRRHGFARAVALEPSPENFQTLAVNIAANRLADRVDALQAAASDSEGRATLDLTWDTGMHRLAAAEVADTAEVETVTLDGLVERGVIDPARVGLVWIDAQGNEPAVLGGATKLLEAGTPLVVSIKPARDRETWLDTGLADRIGAYYANLLELRKRRTRMGDAYPAGRRQRPGAELAQVIRDLPKIQDILLF